MFRRATCSRVASGLAAILCVGLFAGSARSAEDQRQAQRLTAISPSLSWAADDAAFYAALFRGRQQVEIVGRSKAWQRILAMPAVRKAWQEYEQESQKPDSPAGRFRAGLENPAVQDLLEFAGDLFGQEVFVYGDAAYVDFLRLMARVMNTVRSQSLVEEMGDPADDDAAGAAGGPAPPVRHGVPAAGQVLIRALVDNLDLIKVPTTVIGARVKDKDRAQEKIDMASGLIGLATAMVPQLKGKYRSVTVDGRSFLTITLDAKMVPWDEVPLDDLREQETRKGDVDRLVEKIKGLKLVIALGLHDDYVLLAFGPSIDVVKKLAAARPLAGRPEFAKLLPCADKELTSISYCSAAMASQVGDFGEDVNGAVQMADAALYRVNLPAKEKARIRKDLKALADDIRGALPKPGASLAFSYLVPTGYEEYAYDWTQYPWLDATKPLGLLLHVGGDPVGAFVDRGRGMAQQYQAGAKWIAVGYDYFRKYAEPELKSGDGAEFLAFLEKALPLVKRLDKANRELLIPALEGQGGLVLDARLKLPLSTFDKSAPQEPLPMPEPAIVLGVADAGRLVKAGSEYRAAINELWAAIRETSKGEAPPFEIPRPKVKKTPLGTFYTFPLPEEWKVGKKIAPTIAVSDDVAAFTLSRTQAERLLTATPLAVGGVLGDADRPRSSAGLFRWSALVDAAAPWVELAIRGMHESPPPAGKVPKNKDLEEILAQAHTVLDVLGTLRTITAESYLEDGATVSHNRVEFHDVADPAADK